MKILEQMKTDLGLHLNEQAVKNHTEQVFKALFKGNVTPCDCDTCRYAKGCEIDNPDYDANYCKVS